MDDRVLVDLCDLPDAILQVDSSGEILVANSEAVRLLGEPLAGCAVADLKPRVDTGEPLGVEEAWARAQRLHSIRALREQRVTIKTRSGREAVVYVTGRFVRAADGHPTSLILAVRPAEERGRLTDGMEIVSTVSHELRSPLTSVKGYTSMVLQRWDRIGDEDKKMMLEQVNHDADRVTRLIGELLDISRLETGRLVLRRQPLDLRHAAEQVISRVKVAYPALDARLDFEPAPPAVMADPDKITQVLTNLVENACKYGSVIGLVVRGRVQESAVSITVADQGPGISESDLPRVFNKFYRRTDGRPTGSGLGLWISRGLVEAHGGTLEVSSPPGSGAVFTFTLPLGA